MFVVLEQLHAPFYYRKRAITVSHFGQQGKRHMHTLSSQLDFIPLQPLCPGWRWCMIGNDPRGRYNQAIEYREFILLGLWGHPKKSAYNILQGKYVIHDRGRAAFLFFITRYEKQGYTVFCCCCYCCISSLMLLVFLKFIFVMKRFRRCIRHGQHNIKMELILFIDLTQPGYHYWEKTFEPGQMNPMIISTNKNFWRLNNNVILYV